MSVDNGTRAAFSRSSCEASSTLHIAAQDVDDDDAGESITVPERTNDIIGLKFSTDVAAVEMNTNGAEGGAMVTRTEAIAVRTPSDTDTDKIIELLLILLLRLVFTDIGTLVRSKEEVVFKAFQLNKHDCADEV